MTRVTDTTRLDYFVPFSPTRNTRVIHVKQLKALENRHVILTSTGNNIKR